MNEPEITYENFTSPDGNPEGGRVHGCNFAITWQNGPLVAPDGSEIPRNGAFVEDIIHAAKQRIEYYQSTKFKCDENQIAIESLDSALEAIQKRQSRRSSEGTAGTHQVDQEPSAA